MKTLLDNFGTGWKGYLAGVGLLLFSIVLGIDLVLQSIGEDLLPSISTWTEVVETFLAALAVLGIRHAVDK